MAAGVAGGFGVGGVFVQGGVDGDAVGDGEQRGEVGHGVGGGPDADPAVVQGFAVAFDAAGGVEALGDFRGGVRGLPVAHCGQGAGEFGVDDSSVFEVEAGGFPDDQGGPVFADFPGAQGLVGVWHFLGEGFRGADVPVAAGGGVVSGEGDFAVDAAVGVGVALLFLGEAAVREVTKVWVRSAWAAAQADLMRSSSVIWLISSGSGALRSTCWRWSTRRARSAAGQHLVGCRARFPRACPSSVPTCVRLYACNCSDARARSCNSAFGRRLSLDTGLDRDPIAAGRAGERQPPGRPCASSPLPRPGGCNAGHWALPSAPRHPGHLVHPAPGPPAPGPPSPARPARPPRLPGHAQAPGRPACTRHPPQAAAPRHAAHASRHRYGERRD